MGEEDDRRRMYVLGREKRNDKMEGIESENEREGKRRISSPPDFEMYSDRLPL